MSQVLFFLQIRYSLDIIIKCLFIGFLSSAPMGPVGMLCVQRTLNEGRRSGVYTGIGAMMGDMLLAFIAVIAALGLGFTNDIIKEYHAPLQIIGSVILIIFGLIIFQRNPSKNLSKLKENQMSAWKVLISSLILTVSNVGTLFLFMALFARFNVISMNKSFAFDMLIVLFIGIGAILWWIIVTYIVSKLRSRFNPRGLLIFNRIVGTILIVVGLVGIADIIFIVFKY